MNEQWIAEFEALAHELIASEGLSEPEAITRARQELPLLLAGDVDAPLPLAVTARGRAALRESCAPVSARAEAIVSFIAGFVAQHGYAPAYREIMAGTGIPASSSVKYHIDRLVAAGRLIREPGTMRTLRVVE